MPETFELLNDIDADVITLRLSFAVTGETYELTVDPNRYTMEMERRMTGLEARQRDIQRQINDAIRVEGEARTAAAVYQDRVAAALTRRTAILADNPEADDLPKIPEPTAAEKAAMEALREVQGDDDALYDEMLEVVTDMTELAICGRITRVDDDGTIRTTLDLTYGHPLNTEWTREVIGQRLDINQCRSVARFFVQRGSQKRNQAVRWSPIDRPLPTPTAPSRTSGRLPKRR